MPEVWLYQITKNTVPCSKLNRPTKNRMATGIFLPSGTFQVLNPTLVSCFSRSDSKTSMATLINAMPKKIDEG